MLGSPSDVLRDGSGELGTTLGCDEDGCLLLNADDDLPEVNQDLPAVMLTIVGMPITLSQHECESGPGKLTLGGLLPEMTGGNAVFRSVKSTAKLCERH